MRTLDWISAELSAEGFTPEILIASGCPGNGAVIINYRVDTGQYKNKRFKTGIAFKEGGYPEYPPHFICVADIPESSLPVFSKFSYRDSEWSVFSVPPSDFWDSLPSSDKNMKTYINRHLARFWNQI